MIKSIYKLTLLSLFFVQQLLSSEPNNLRSKPPLYTEPFVKEFPFFEAMVDFRTSGPEGNSDNLVPRAIVLPLGEDVFVCFDTELLRVAGIWQGKGLSPDSLALRSYAKPLKKQPAGQKKLPKPLGRVFVTTGLYPGWQRGPVTKEDPRPKGLDEKELGRGPLPKNVGTWLGVEDKGRGATLHYSIFGTPVEEHFSVSKEKDKLSVHRTIVIQSVEKDVTLVFSEHNGSLNTTEIPVSQTSQTITCTYPFSTKLKPSLLKINPSEKTKPLVKTQKHWPKLVNTTFKRDESEAPYALDQLTFPYPNVWERRIRTSAIDFFSNGDAVIVTFDGDVYRLTNLAIPNSPVTWTRIAAGFFEPSSIRVRDDEVYVYSRLGITKLVDKNNDGETDYYQLVANNFLQSAETRDLPLSLTPWENDSWIVTKGGQQSSHLSPDSGRVIQVSKNGSERSYWAYGLRNGFINTIPERNLLVASDQQGNWVPATPLHIVKKDSFLGYELGAPLKRTIETQPPILWFPHRVARSGIDVIWGSDSRLGPLHQNLLYLDYTNPSLHKVFLPKDDLTQTAAVPLNLKLNTPILKGAVNPADGQIYLVGFQIWDSSAERLEGLVRLRVQAEDDGLPSQAKVFKEGISLTFQSPIDREKALNPASYQLSSWNYLRNKEYGSAQYTAEGAPGVDELLAHRILLSDDGKSVFIAIKDFTPAMQVELQYSFDETWKPVYYTAHKLPSVSSSNIFCYQTNFEEIFQSKSLPRPVLVSKSIISALRGQQVATAYGCVGCHSIDGSTDGKSGPSWKGIFKKRRLMSDGKKVLVDDKYLRESILEPKKQRLPGYDGEEAGMASYQGILSDAEIESVILYIKNLR